MKSLEIFYQTYLTIASGAVLSLTTSSQYFTGGWWFVLYVLFILFFGAFFSIGFLKIVQHVKDILPTKTNEV